MKKSLLVAALTLALISPTYAGVIDQPGITSDPDTTNQTCGVIDQPGATLPPECTESNTEENAEEGTIESAINYLTDLLFG